MGSPLPFDDWLTFARYGQHVDVTADGIISDRPSFLFGLTLIPTAAGECDAYIYDSQGADKEISMTLWSVIGDALREAYWPPLYFKRGIYVNLDTNVKVLRVHFMVDPRA